MQSATKPFTLIFCKKFGPNWKLEGYQLSTEHYLVYNLANAWLVNKTGDFSLRIYYAPKIVYEITIATTIIGLITLFSLLIFKSDKKRSI